MLDVICHIKGYKWQNSKICSLSWLQNQRFINEENVCHIMWSVEQTVRLNKCPCLLCSHIALHGYYHDLYGNSLISRTDKVELIATDFFFSNPPTVWVILSEILKVGSPIMWESMNTYF